MNCILRRRIRNQASILSRLDENDISSASDLFNPVDESDIVDRNTDLYTPFISRGDDELDVVSPNTVEKI